MKRRLFQICVLLAACLIVPAAMAAAPSLPECVHWSTPFVFPEFLEKAKVTGVPGQRLYLRNPNPELCALDDLAGALECKPKSYLIPGDRVTLGLVCGSRAFVQFIRGNRYSSGWVELPRLEKLPPSTQDLAERKKWRRPLENSSLVHAIYDGNAALALQLMAAGHDPNVALLNAVKTNQMDIALAALARGANPNTVKTNCDVMQAAAVEGNVPMLEALILAGGKAKCNQGQGLTPLMAGAMIGRASFDLGRALGWMQNRNPTPVDAARLLVEHGADVNAQIAGDTALRHTLQDNNVDVAKYLLAAGADPNVGRVNFGYQSGDTVLMEAIGYYQLTLDPTMLRLLLEHKADANFRNAAPYNAQCDGTTKGSSSGCEWAGQTALTWAAMKGMLTVAKLLLPFGADPTRPRSDGALPVEVAREFGHPAVAAVIEEYARSQKK